VKAESGKCAAFDRGGLQISGIGFDAAAFQFCPD
jgi:hypothetical protein